MSKHDHKPNDAQYVRPYNTQLTSLLEDEAGEKVVAVTAINFGDFTVTRGLAVAVGRRAFYPVAREFREHVVRDYRYRELHKNFGIKVSGIPSILEQDNRYRLWAIEGLGKKGIELFEDFSEALFTTPSSK